MRVSPLFSFPFRRARWIFPVVRELTTTTSAIDEETKEDKPRKGSLRSSGRPGTEILFGIHPVAEALRQSRRELHGLFVREDFASNPRLAAVVAAAQRLQLPVKMASIARLDRLAKVDKFNNFRPHQGVCLSCGQIDPVVLSSYDDFLTSFPIHTQWLFPFLVDINDPMNFGAILRAAFFFGVGHVIVHGHHSLRRPTPVVSKASSGAAESIRFAEVTDAVSFLVDAKDAGDAVIGTMAPDAVMTPPPPGLSIRDAASGLNVQADVVFGADGRRTTFLLFGSEGAGLDERLQRLCDYRLTIGAGAAAAAAASSSVDSLNVGVAAGIVFHELLTREGREERTNAMMKKLADINRSGLT